MNFIMLNPSTADEVNDDHTVRRCIGFAETWGYGGLIVTNLFAMRSPDPGMLKQVHDPIGPDNTDYLLKYALKCDRVVCAWGNHGSYRGRDQSVVEFLWGRHQVLLSYLLLTKSGQPSHPLRLSGKLRPKIWIPGRHESGLQGLQDLESC